MADFHREKIKEMRTAGGKSTSLYIFKDGSGLLFSISPNPNPRIMGSENSDANRFASDVATFTTKQDGHEFIFKDESKLTVGLGDAARTS